MLLRQFADEGNLAYLLADEATGEAVIIDPIREKVNDLVAIVHRDKLKVTAVIDTHSHADHYTGAGILREKLGSAVIMSKATGDQRKFDADLGKKFGIEDILSYNSTIQVDRYVGTGDTLQVGSVTITFYETPGHTLNSLSLKAGHYLFTGDSLMIGQTGRLDLPGGNAAAMFNSLHKVIAPLAGDDTILCPGHDYDHHTSRFLKDELAVNPFFKPQTAAEFTDFTSQFFPPLKLDDMGGVSKIQCGAAGGPAPEPEKGVFNILPADLNDKMDSDASWVLIDVREPFETANGMAPKAVNIPMSQLETRLGEIPKNKRVAIICASGGRSARVAGFLHQQGWPTIYNVSGGMMSWMMNFLPVNR